MNDPAPTAVVRDGIACAVGVLGLAGIGLLHLRDAPSKYAETPDMFWMYIALIAGRRAIAGELIRTGSRLALIGAGTLALSAPIGFTPTRTVGVFQAHGDVGDRSKPLGLVPLWLERCVFALNAAAMTASIRVRRAAPGGHHTPATGG